MAAIHRRLDPHFVHFNRLLNQPLSNRKLLFQ